MHDTFYLNNKTMLLRTHTSPVQIRGCNIKQTTSCFFRVGRFIEKMMTQLTYPCFIKLKGLFVDEDVNFSNLKDLNIYDYK